MHVGAQESPPDCRFFCRISRTMNRILALTLRCVPHLCFRVGTECTQKYYDSCFPPPQSTHRVQMKHARRKVFSPGLFLIFANDFPPHLSFLYPFSLKISLMGMQGRCVTPNSRPPGAKPGVFLEPCLLLVVFFVPP